MAAALTVNYKSASGKTVELFGTVALSGSYATGGDSLPLTGSGSTKAALIVTVVGKAGYFYEYDLATSKLRVRQCAAAGNPLAELSAGAYAGGVSGDTIQIRAVFPKFG